MLVENDTGKDIKYKLECGPYGLIQFVLPPGNRFTWEVGTFAGKIYLNNVDLDIADSDNVICIDDRD